MSGRNESFPERSKDFMVGPVVMKDLRSVSFETQRKVKQVGAAAAAAALAEDMKRPDLICKPDVQLRRHGFQEKLKEARERAGRMGELFDEPRFQREFRAPLEDWENDPDEGILNLAMTGARSGLTHGFVSLYNLRADRSGPTIKLSAMFGPLFEPFDEDRPSGRFRTIGRLLVWFMKNDIPLGDSMARVTQWRFATEDPQYRWSADLPFILESLREVADVVIGRDSIPPYLVAATRKRSARPLRPRS